MAEHDHLREYTFHTGSAVFAIPPGVGETGYVGGDPAQHAVTGRGFVAVIRSASKALKREPARASEPEGLEAKAAQLETNLLTELSKKRLKLIKFPRDPELRKVLGVIHARVGDLRTRLERGPARLSPTWEGRLSKLLSIPVPATLDTAWQIADAFKMVLLQLSDDGSLRAQLENERTRDRRGGPGRWSEFFEPDDLRDALTGFAQTKIDDQLRSLALARLEVLYEARADAGRHVRARAKLRRSYLLRLVPVVAGLIVLFGSAVFLIGDRGAAAVWELLVVFAAGALGAVLSGIYKLRDELVKIGELRSFWPAIVVQPFIGGAAGLVILLFGKSNLLSIAEGTAIEDAPPAVYGAVAFVAGFSEPFFLGIVGRIAGSEGKSR